MSISIQQLGSKFLITKPNVKKFENTFNESINSFLFTHDWNTTMEEKNITNIYMAGDYLDVIGLRKIAPYVKSGSYLEFQNEYGERFRYVFKNKEVYYITATIKWPKV
jgi:hypothetical protein